MQRILSTVWLSVLAGSAAMSLVACDDPESLEALDGELAEDEAIDGDLAVAEDEQDGDVFEFTPPTKNWPDDIAAAPRDGEPEDTLAAANPPSPRPAGLTTPPMSQTPPYAPDAKYAAFDKPNLECICTDEKQPVCGVDGETYQNSCAAVCSGVEVEHQGACEEEGCFCTLEYDPVCGVDGKTYGNACAAGCADVDIDHEGTCEPASCTSDDECDPLEFCERDMVCGGPGTCMTKPDSCLDKSAPVCGCDGQVYDSPCMAHVHGVSVGPEDGCDIEEQPEEPTPEK